MSLKLFNQFITKLLHLLNSALFTSVSLSAPYLNHYGGVYTGVCEHEIQDCTEYYILKEKKFVSPVIWARADETVTYRSVIIMPTS